MLVLTRKKMEEIVIGDDIVVKVLKLRRDRVSLGIEAPKSVRIVRGEVAPTPRIPTRETS